MIEFNYLVHDRLKQQKLNAFYSFQRYGNRFQLNNKNYQLKFLRFELSTCRGKKFHGSFYYALIRSTVPRRKKKENFYHMKPLARFHQFTSQSLKKVRHVCVESSSE